jgi:hypothetical protein
MAPREIEDFAKAVMACAGGLDVTYDRPASPSTGLWWIDIRLGERFAAISWEAEKGFQFYNEDDPGYGHEAPIKRIAEPAAAARHYSKVLAAQDWPLRPNLIPTDHSVS